MHKADAELKKNIYAEESKGKLQLKLILIQNDKILNSLKIVVTESVKTSSQGES